MGSDKGLVQWKGKPLAQYVIEAAAPVASSITLVTANPDYRQFGLPVITDQVPGLGPAGGLATVFQHTDGEQVLVLGCDMPLLTEDVLRLLIERSEIKAINLPTAMAREHPLCAVYPTSIREQWDKLLVKGERKLRQMVRHFKVCELPFDGNEKAFTNVNTLQSLNKLEP